MLSTNQLPASRQVGVFIVFLGMWLDIKLSWELVYGMKRVSRLIRLSLAAALVFGGAITHADSLAHAHSNYDGVPHQHIAHAEAHVADVSAKADHSGSDTDGESSNHGSAVCLDAQCCTPAVHPVTQEFLQTFERDRFGPAPAPDYALSVTFSLLKPPRDIT